MNRRSATRGATMIELLLAVVLVLLPLALGTLQVAHLIMGKHLLNLATLMAARAAAVNHGSVGAMREELARGLVPLYGNATELAESNAVTPVLEALARATAEVVRSDITRIVIDNPTRDSFADFEVEHRGVRQIPNGHLEYRGSRSGARSRQTLLDANTLVIRVYYCQRLIFPLVDRAIPALLATTERDVFARNCYDNRRVPLMSRSIVIMHSPPRRAAMGL
jgi:hypothetical protein